MANLRGLGVCRGLPLLVVLAAWGCHRPTAEPAIGAIARSDGAVQHLLRIRLPQEASAARQATGAANLVLTLGGADSGEATPLIGHVGGELGTELRVSLTASDLRLPFLVAGLYPVGDAGANSPALRIVAADAADSGDPALEDGGRLRALFDPTVAATDADPEADVTELSLASTLCLDLLDALSSDLTTPVTKTSYRRLLAILGSQEKALISSLPPSGSSQRQLVGAVRMALRAKIVADAGLQESVLSALVSAWAGADLSLSLKKFVFLMDTWGTTLDADLASQARVLGSTGASLRDMASSHSSTAPSLAPAQVRFLGVASTQGINGSVTVRPGSGPVVATGFEIFLGAEAIDLGRQQFLGRVESGGDDVLALQAVVPGRDQSYLWAWPVFAGEVVRAPAKVKLLMQAATSANSANTSPDGSLAAVVRPTSGGGVGDQNDYLTAVDANHASVPLPGQSATGSTAGSSSSGLPAATSPSGPPAGGTADEAGKTQAPTPGPGSAPSAPGGSQTPDPGTPGAPSPAPTSPPPSRGGDGTGDPPAPGTPSPDPTSPPPSPSGGGSSDPAAPGLPSPDPVSPPSLPGGGGSGDPAAPGLPSPDPVSPPSLPGGGGSGDPAAPGLPSPDPVSSPSLPVGGGSGDPAAPGLPSPDPVSPPSLPVGGGSGDPAAPGLPSPDPVSPPSLPGGAGTGDSVAPGISIPDPGFPSGSSLPTSGAGNPLADAPVLDAGVDLHLSTSSAGNAVAAAVPVLPTGSAAGEAGDLLAPGGIGPPAPEPVEGLEGAISTSPPGAPLLPQGVDTAPATTPDHPADSAPQSAAAPVIETPALPVPVVGGGAQATSGVAPVQASGGASATLPNAATPAAGAPAPAQPSTPNDAGNAGAAAVDQVGLAQGQGGDSSNAAVVQIGVSGAQGGTTGAAVVVQVPLAQASGGDTGNAAVVQVGLASVQGGSATVAPVMSIAVPAAQGGTTLDAAAAQATPATAPDAAAATGGASSSAAGAAPLPASAVAQNANVPASPANGAGTGQQAAAASGAGSAGTALACPASVRVVAVGDGFVDVAWDAVANAASYNVYWGTSVPLLAGTAARVTQATSPARLWGLVNEQPVFASASTVSQANQESSLSTPVRAVPLAPLAPPSALAVTHQGANVTLLWPQVVGAEGYRLLWSHTSPATDGDGEVDGISSPYTVTGLAPGEIRYAVICATRAGQKGVSSAEVVVANSQLDFAAAAGLASGAVLGVGAGGRVGFRAAVGQANLTSSVAGTTAARFGGGGGLGGIAVANNGTVFLGDGVNNRILGYRAAPRLSGAVADFVVNAGSASQAGASGLGAAEMSGPRGLFADGAWLLAADLANGRLLGWSPVPDTGPTVATRVWGTGGFGSPPPTATGPLSIRSPQSVHAGGGRLLICDQASHRVLVYSVFPPAADRAPDYVLGQPSLTASVENNGGLGPRSLSRPSGVWTDGQRVLVYDAGNRRILLWRTFPAASQAPADVVLGQQDFVHNGSNQGALLPSAATLAAASVAADAPGVASNGLQIVASDSGNYRLMVWNSFPDHNGAAADFVIGQASAAVAVAPVAPTATTVSRPTAVYLDTKQLIAADAGFNRYLVLAL